MNELQGNDCYRVLDNEQLILFYFTASWCGPCQKIYPHILEIIKQIDSNKLQIYKIDIDHDDNQELCEKCQIKSVPSFLLFKKRDCIGQCKGANIQNVIKLLNNHLS
tara:strand:- start:132 stop:452 length:321 start_codon:yes stop_codon:yes gene_type:complete